MLLSGVLWLVNFKRFFNGFSINGNSIYSVTHSYRLFKRLLMNISTRSITRSSANKYLIMKALQK